MKTTFPWTLSKAQELLVKQWAADDRLWTTQETVEFNLRVFARAVLTAKPDVSVPDSDPFRLTRFLINNCRTEKGGFTNATLKAFGIKETPKKGWGRRLWGMWITQAEYKNALDGRFIYGAVLGSTDKDDLTVG